MIDEELINKIMKCFFENNKEIEQFKEQYKKSKINKIDRTGVGFFAEFIIDNKLVKNHDYNNIAKNVFYNF